MVTKIPLGSIKGDPGAPSTVPGPPGPNSIPTDTFVADKIADPASATGAALTAKMAAAPIVGGAP